MSKSASKYSLLSQINWTLSYKITILLQYRSKSVIMKGTWPENLKDTREKIRKCKAGEKEGQVISEDISDESKETSGEAEEGIHHEVANFESDDGINRDDEIKVHMVSLVSVLGKHFRLIKTNLLTICHLSYFCCFRCDQHQTKILLQIPQPMWDLPQPLWNQPPPMWNLPSPMWNLPQPMWNQHQPMWNPPQLL